MRIRQLLADNCSAIYVLEGDCIAPPTSLLACKTDKFFGDILGNSGNNFATKNQIAIKIWVTDTIEIPRDTSHKQNR